MKHYAGLDVSVKESAFCVVNEGGWIWWGMKTQSHPEDLASALGGLGVFRIERIGLEAGPVSQWIFERRASAGLPVICIETRRSSTISSPSPISRRPSRRSPTAIQKRR